MMSPGARGRSRLIAGAVRWDAGAMRWAQPSLTTTQTTSPGSLMLYPRVYELSFHHDEPNSLWSDTGQAQDLRAGSAGAHDGWTVDVSQLQRGASVPVPCSAGPKEETF